MWISCTVPLTAILLTGCYWGFEDSLIGQLPRNRPVSPGAVDKIINLQGLLPGTKRASGKIGRDYKANETIGRIFQSI